MSEQTSKDGSEEDNNIRDKDPNATRSPKLVVSNGGIKETGNKEIMIDTNSPKNADSNNQLDANLNMKIEFDEGVAQKPVNCRDKPESVESQQVLDNHEIPGKMFIFLLLGLNLLKQPIHTKLLNA